MLSVLATLIILIGLILVPLPVPFGVFFIVAGLAMLLSVNPKAQQKLQQLRRENPRLNLWLHEVTKRAPRFLRVVLHKTRHRPNPPSRKLLLRNNSQS
ncbi:PGPGW domain-containing protein [Planctobacterium marinum]|uniref:PGPGW domain-containing protein n=1 Tax=Planctobacterium marinum TaxID=1631968 RepID=UPI003CC82CFD